jgi:coenzyme PQQ synthesis protein D (PqqD)
MSRAANQPVAEHWADRLSLVMGSHATIRSTVVRVPDQASAEVGDEAVLLQLSGGIYYSVDGIGMQIWRRLAEPCSVLNLRDEIVASYDVDEATCTTDLLSFLNSLSDANLIEIRNEDR